MAKLRSNDGLERFLIWSDDMTEQEIVALAEEHGLCTIVPDAGYQHDALWFDANLIEFAKAVEKAEHAACVKACEAAEDTGDGRGIERDVAMWNKAVAYCVRRLKERSNVQDNRASRPYREAPVDRRVGGGES